MKNLLLSLLFLLPLVCLAGKTYTVTVVVKSLDGAIPLKGVTVEYLFKGQIVFTELTNEEGKAVFSDCAEKDFLLKCKPDDQTYMPDDMGFGNYERGNIEHEFRLSYEKAKELAFVARKTALPEIDSTYMPKDSCKTTTMPDYPGGRDELVQFLRENLVIPSVAEELGIKGKVYLEFMILQDGTIAALHVKKGIPDCPECDAEALRIVAYMPKWSPATCNDKPVIDTYILPLIYHVE